MKAAVVLVARCGLPAFIVLARINLYHLRLVLPEIQSFGRMDLAPNRQLEILVRYLAVSI